MIRHLLRLMWNRRRANGLVAVEILCSFLVVFAVAALGSWLADNHRQPLGFDYQGVWSVEMSAPRRETGWTDADKQAVTQVLAAVREQPEVEGVAIGAPLPWSDAHDGSVFTQSGRRVRYGLANVSDDFARVMRLQVTAGRWFSREDDGAGWQPVVITERLARAAFGDAPPLGRDIAGDPEPGMKPGPQMRVVGVVREYRQDGEYGAPENYLFVRETVAEDHGLPALVVRVRPGAGPTLEAALAQRMAAAGPRWSYRVRPLSETRASQNRFRLLPLVAAAVVAAFLMLMVALGLSGVLWLSITQRTRELGLRRAKGASAAAIRAQLVGEILVVTTAAVGLGTVVVLQIPLLELVTGVRPGVYASSLVIAAACIYGLAMACGVYPSVLAARMTPAEALRHE